MISSSHRYTIYTIFALSGFTALVYEILWAKQLSLIFGTSMVAVSIVAATFMGGIALGSSLFGRFSDHHNDWLRIYAVLEIGIALCAMTFPFALELIRDSYVDLSSIWPDSPLYAHSLQFLQTVVLLLLPASLMGGTFPVVCRQFARHKSGAQIGRLYAFNTLGATLGAFSCGYLLIPHLGISGTNRLAIAINLLVVVLAWVLGKVLGPGEVMQAFREHLSLDRDKYVILACVALAGFFSLAYEILWTRVLLLFLGNTSYAFSLILSCFLIGIAFGGWLYARIAHPQMNEKGMFILFTAGMATCMLLSVPFYDQLAYLFNDIHLVSGERWWLLSLLNWLATFAIMGIPAVFSGALLPAGVALINPGRQHTGSGVGLVVCYNTLGAVFGSLVAGFVMVPWVGLQNSFMSLIILQILVAIFLLLYFHHRNNRTWALLTILSIFTLLGAKAPTWDSALMNSGVYCYSAKYAAMGGLDMVLGKERIIETIEVRDTTVAVHENLDGSVRFFTVNGKTDGGNGSDTTTQILIGHLPLLLHPETQTALVIGLGTGITLKGLPEYVSESIDCVEISPEVVSAEAYFSNFNGNALKDKKINLLINDGRNHLLARKQVYDVIISEPSNPWQSGNANLFTQEFYELAAKRLKLDGVFSQWIGLYDITPENLRMACRTLQKVFPNILAFHSGSDLILLASKKPSAFDYRQLDAHLQKPRIRDILSRLQIESPGDLIARHYLFGTESIKQFAGKGPLNHDNHPVLEYSAHHNLGGATLGALQERNMRALHAARQREMLPLNISSISEQMRIVALKDLGNAFRDVGLHPEADFFLSRAQEVAAQL